jgi:hypothetical protein
MDKFGRSSWGNLFANTAGIGAREALVAVLIAALCALLAWALFHVIAPAYEAVAAIVTFVVLVLVLLLL